MANYRAACRSPADISAAKESACSLALANMTGSNRLLIGIGWSMVVFVAWWRWRKRGQPERGEGVRLERSHSVEIAYLALATVYCLTLPLRHTITLIDAAVLISVFVLYTVRISRAPAEEPHLVGPARYIGTFSVANRRATVVALFVCSALVIFLCADHFAHALVATGQAFGISEFLLVQWLAPLASEAPELLVAGLYAWRLNTSSGLGTLVSSKVNQWTLLVGTLPIAFAIFSGGLHGLPLDTAQREEVLLTAAQSVFAVTVLANLSLSVREAWALLLLFVGQFLAGALMPSDLHGVERLTFTAAYLLLAAGITITQHRSYRNLARDGFRTPYAELEESV